MYREANSQSERLAALYRVSSRLGTTLDLTEVLNLVIDSVIQLTGAERGFIVLTDTFGRLNIMAARNLEAKTLDEDKVTVSRTIVQRVVATGEPVLTNNAQDDARFADRASVIGFQFRSIMCAPLRARGRVNGAVFVDNRMLSGVFSDDDLELLVTFANQAAMAIDNARLFQQTDMALTRRVEELTLFQRIDRDLHKSLDLDQTLELVLSWAVRLTDAQNCTAGLLEPGESASEQSLRLFTDSQSGADADNDEPLLSLALEDKNVKTVFETGESVQIKDAIGDDGLVKQEAKLYMPIALEGNVLGIMALESHSVSSFRTEDVEFIRRLADRAAVAIGNSRLYQALQQAVDERSKFVSIMTHELRLPLTSIRGYADLLAKQLVGPLNDQQQNFVDTIQRNIMRMSTLISDLADINKIESELFRLDAHEFEIGKAIDEAAEKQRGDIEAKSQTLTLEADNNSVKLNADYGRVVQMLSNLISNANKYTPENGVVTVRCLGAAAGFVTIQVEDNGFGIKKEEIDQIFQQFFRSEDQAIREQIGWGLGLSIVQLMTDRMGGSVDVVSDYGNGTVVTLKLPTG